jgi:hypothetical protein
MIRIAFGKHELWEKFQFWVENKMFYIFFGLHKY